MAPGHLLWIETSKNYFCIWLIDNFFQKFDVDRILLICWFFTFLAEHINPVKNLKINSILSSQNWRKSYQLNETQNN
jgi:hypothetical protein